MKKLLVVVAFLTVALCATAQPRAIGARLGYDLEVSYQHGFGSSNMLDCSLGFGLGNWISATAVYDWIWNISGGWNWYAGPGAGVSLGLWDGGGHFGINVGGQIGVEYNFNIPLNLSLDYRPMINLLGFGNDHWMNFYSVALGVRYRF